MRKLMLHRLVLAVIMTAVLATGVTAAPQVEDFTFIQLTDIHAPMPESAATIAQIPTLGDIPLKPYNVTAKPPSFVIATGDLTEFGGYMGAWETFMSYWKDFKIPVYLVAGNHDNTWDSIRYRLRNLPQKAPYFSFDMHGCHFIGLESATMQEPLPNFPEEEISWVKKDLEKVDRSTPIFIFFHHPLRTTEFTSEYDKSRLLDMLKGYNVAGIFGGHSHGTEYRQYSGFDCVLGGSPYGKKPGYAVVSVLNSTLRVTYKLASETEATEALLEKPLLPAKPQPKISFTSPKLRESYKGDVKITAWIKLPKEAVKEAKWKLDGDKEGVLEAKNGGSFEAVLGSTDLAPGAHYVTASFTTPEGAVYDSSVSFYYDASDSPLVWRAFLPGSVKGQMTVDADTLYAGGGDGILYALNARNGKVKWTFATGGEILSQPLVTAEAVYVTSGDGRLYCLDKKGKQKWSFTAAGPIYSSPIMADGKILFGCSDSDFYAVDALKGGLAWKFVDPLFTMECKPFTHAGVVYFGAWDGFIYAVNIADGTPVWKCMGKGAATQKASRYFSAADCGPVVTNGKLFAADRNYDISIIDLASASILNSLDTCSGVGLSEDGKNVYLRRTKGDLTKIDTEGNVVWSVPAGLNRVPTAPTESDGVVYVCSASGLASAMAADDGKKLWEYRVTPYLFVLGAVEARNGVAYVGGMDGSVTALKTVK